MRGKTSQSAGVQEPEELRAQGWRSKWGQTWDLKASSMFGSLSEEQWEAI